MKTGTIKFFNESKGYGFITDSTSQDHFVHITALDDEVKGLEMKEGHKVTFETIDTPRGSNATNVRLE
ncbi:MAG: cold-shock protein [Candidatus Amoebophilus sp. 36-38]|nr:MAG: cold-shock protein [Candidatus Amoebophilus sp. 36-38]